MSLKREKKILILTKPNATFSLYLKHANSRAKTVRRPATPIRDPRYCTPPLTSFPHR
ncbi:unnamed protein product [Citrullus colocynthis]|uniref:Ribosomal protein L33 n=1 Tax=Citrullus colocynthis TaxID=252529 RepID=A0ABP0Z2B9_9ROSI